MLMEIFRAMDISANGLQTQRIVVDAISQNLSNVHTTRTEGGGPYRRKQAIFSAVPLSRKFPDLLFSKMGQEILEVKVDVVEDARQGQKIYDPTHPDADETGVVTLPNVNVFEEMVALLGALRSYEANVTAFQASKQMALKALEIGK